MASGYTYDNYGEQDELEQLLQMFRARQGGMSGGGVLGKIGGAGNMAGVASANPWVAAGGQVAGILGGLLQGDTWGEKKTKDLYRQGEAELAKPGLNANDYYAGITDTAVRSAGKLAPQLERKYGGGGGYGGAMLSRVAEEAVPAVTNAQFGVDQFNANRKLRLMEYLRNLSAGM